MFQRTEGWAIHGYVKAKNPSWLELIGGGNTVLHTHTALANPDASATVKGITKLSVAPASATNPIALGVNDAASTVYFPAMAPTGTLTVTIPNRGAGATYKMLVESNQISDATMMGLQVVANVAQTVDGATPFCVTQNSKQMLCVSRLLSLDVVAFAHASWYVADAAPPVFFSATGYLWCANVVLDGAVPQITNNANAAIGIRSNVTDGGTAIACDINSTNALSTAGALLLRVRNDDAVKFSLDKDGGLTSYGALQSYMSTSSNVFKSNTTAGAGVSAWVFDTFNALGAGRAIEFKVNGTAWVYMSCFGDFGGIGACEFPYFKSNGATYGVYFANAAAKHLNMAANATMFFNNTALTDGATAIAYKLDTTNALSTAGAKLLSIRNATAEKFGLDKDGYVYISGTKVVGAQGASVADATDAASAITQLNALLARARAHGLIAT